MNLFMLKFSQIIYSGFNSIRKFFLWIIAKFKWIEIQHFNAALQKKSKRLCAYERATMYNQNVKLIHGSHMWRMLWTMITQPHLHSQIIWSIWLYACAYLPNVMKSNGQHIHFIVYDTFTKMHIFNTFTQTTKYQIDTTNWNQTKRDTK